MSCDNMMIKQYPKTKKINVNKLTIIMIYFIKLLLFHFIIILYSIYRTIAYVLILYKWEHPLCQLDNPLNLLSFFCYSICLLSTGIYLLQFYFRLFCPHCLRIQTNFLIAWGKSTLYTVFNLSIRFKELCI